MPERPEHDLGGQPAASRLSGGQQARAGAGTDAVQRAEKFWCWTIPFSAVDRPDGGTRFWPKTLREQCRRQNTVILLLSHRLYAASRIWTGCCFWLEGRRGVLLESHEALMAH
jgi:ABC-type thiamine transport system ATPase subunit